MFESLQLALFSLFFAVIASPAAYAQISTAEYDIPLLPEDGHLLTRGEMVEGFAGYFSFFDDDAVALAKKKDTLFFSDVWPAHSVYNSTAFLCIHGILSCSKDKAFEKDAVASFESMLKVYYELRYFHEGRGYIPTKYGNPQPWYFPYKIEAIKDHLVEDREAGTMSRREFLQFLRKDYVFWLFDHSIGYFKGLEYTTEHIAQGLFTLEELEEMQRQFQLLMTKVHTNVQKHYIEERTEALQKRIEEKKYNPLQEDPTYTREWKDMFLRLGIKEELGYGEYRFRTNAAYRKHNILTALKKIHGHVLEVGETFDYWEYLDAKGLDDIVSGWTVNGGKELWEWGGGLCGSATALFRAAWFSGLEIVERKPHSSYLTAFYAKKDIGLDAAVYRMSPNLRFKNSTQHPVVLYMTYEEEPGWGVVRMHVLGVKHFESMTFPDLIKQKSVYIRQRIMTFSDGNIQEDSVRSSYSKIE